MRESDPVVVALGGHEHLGLVLEPPERLGMDDAVAVALERRAERVRLLVPVPALGLGGQHRSLGEHLAFDPLGSLSDGRAGECHRTPG